MNDFSVAHNGWVANALPDQTFLEKPPREGKKSSWQQLLDLVRTGEVVLTGLRMQRHGLTFHTLPVKQCDGYFQAYEVRKKFYGSMGKHGQPEQVFQGVGSVVGDQVFITWVNISPRSYPFIYQDVRSLKESILHTTMS